MHNEVDLLEEFILINSVKLDSLSNPIMCKGNFMFLSFCPFGKASIAPLGYIACNYHPGLNGQGWIFLDTRGLHL